MVSPGFPQVFPAFSAGSRCGRQLPNLAEAPLGDPDVAEELRGLGDAAQDLGGVTSVNGVSNVDTSQYTYIYICVCVYIYVG